MKTPQIIFLTLMAVGLLISASKHGQPREDNNFWVSLIAAGISLALLIWGGFFK